MNDMNKKGMNYYSRDDLHLSSDVPGAKQWAVARQQNYDEASCTIFVPLDLK